MSWVDKRRKTNVVGPYTDHHFMANMKKRKQNTATEAHSNFNLSVASLRKYHTLISFLLSFDVFCNNNFRNNSQMYTNVFLVYNMFFSQQRIMCVSVDFQCLFFVFLFFSVLLFNLFFFSPRFALQSYSHHSEFFLCVCVDSAVVFSSFVVASLKNLSLQICRWHSWVFTNFRDSFFVVSVCFLFTNYIRFWEKTIRCQFAWEKFIHYNVFHHLFGFFFSVLVLVSVDTNESI